MAIQSPCDSPTPIHPNLKVPQHSIGCLASEVLGTALLLQQQVQTLENLAHATEERQLTLVHHRARLQELLRLVTSVETAEIRATASLKETLVRVRTARIVHSLSALRLAPASPRPDSSHILGSPSRLLARETPERIGPENSRDGNGGEGEEKDEDTARPAAGASNESTSGGVDTENQAPQSPELNALKLEDEDAVEKPTSEGRVDTSSNPSPSQPRHPKHLVRAHADPHVEARSHALQTHTAPETYGATRLDPRLSNAQMTSTRHYLTPPRKREDLRPSQPKGRADQDDSWRARQRTPLTATPSPKGGHFRGQNTRAQGATSMARHSSESEVTTTFHESAESQRGMAEGGGCASQDRRHWHPGSPKRFP